jgi:hypothetical protein
MHDQHLRPVPSVDNTDPEGSEAPKSGTESSEEAGTQPAQVAKRPRSRPKKALPTDRMKFEVQKQALSTIAILSAGEQGVSAADMAASMDVVASTAGLSNAFFLESGLIERAGKGRYKSTEAANDFARRFSFDQDQAGTSLKNTLSETWYYKAVEQHLRGFGSTPKEKLIELLAYKAETTKDYRVQLGALLSWLEYAGLIAFNDGQYQLADDAPAPTTISVADTTPEESRGGDKPAPSPERPTTPPLAADDKAQPTETILGFSFDFALTGDQLAKLSPEQITALFKAVGEVMAIKAAAT